MTMTVSHKDCADGFAAAYCVWKKFPDTVIYFCHYNEPIPREVLKAENETIYIVDFSFPADTLLELAKKNTVYVFDHHKTAKENLDSISNISNLNIVFDMEKCGIIITYEQLFPDKTPPELLHYIQDRDLWQWKLPHSREISAALKLSQQLYKRYEESDLQTFDFLVECFPTMKPKMVNDGKIILTTNNQIVESIASKAKMHVIWGTIVPCVNSPILQSEIGERLLTLYPEARFAAIYFHLDPYTRVYSLRSRGDYDVSLVAKHFDGGGHAAAAGFKVLATPDGFSV